MTELVFSHRLFNPLFRHVRKAMRDTSVRYIMNRGGSSSGKSVAVAQSVLLSVLAGEGSALVMRKVGASIRNTVYEEFRTQAGRLGISGFLTFRENSVACVNGRRIDFTGLDDPEKIKSVTGYRWIVMEEATEFEYADFTQIRFRLRGKEGLQIICNFNPVSEDSWIKTKVIDTMEWDDLPVHLYGEVRDPVTGTVLPEEYSAILGKRAVRPRGMANERTGVMEEYPSDMIELVSSYRNNFWVVGSPDGRFGYYDRQTISNYLWYREHDYNYYRVYALGEWGSIKTGGEFLHAFDSNRHIGNFPYREGLPVHVSVDNNVLPYISVSFFQTDGRALVQFHEICASDPHNTVTQAARMASDYLLSIGYNDVVYLYGDASTRSGNTIDDDRRSFLDKFVEGLEGRFHVEDRVPECNPSVPMSGEFVNHILSGGSGLSFRVDEGCKNSIVDYNNAKKDVNGGMLKARVKDRLTGQSYERYGHLTDCLRYVAVAVFRDGYTRFSLRRKRSVIRTDDDTVRYYDASKEIQGERLVYVLPECDGKSVMLSCVVSGGIYIDGAFLYGTFDDGAVMRFIEGVDPSEVLFESGRNYFPVARGLRETRSVRIIHESADKEGRISAFAGFIRSRVMFRGDCDTLQGYAEFMDAALDYDGSGCRAAMYAVASLCDYVSRKYDLSAG